MVHAKGEVSGQQQSLPGIFHREHEEAKLNAHLAQAPATVLLVVGPQNVGKSTTLRAVLSSETWRDGVLSFDGRGVGATSPAAFVLSLMKQASERPAWQAAATEIGSVKGEYLPGFDLPKAFATFSAAAMFAAPHRAALRALQEQAMAVDPLEPLKGQVVEAIGRLRRKGVTPIIFIDEAHVLRQWEDLNPSALMALLQFLVLLSKGEERAHVILATSDSACIDWLALKIGASFMTVNAIGEMPKDEALCYMRWLAGQRTTGHEGDLEMDGEEWDLVYQVCGGNPGFLQTVSSHRAQGESWRFVLARFKGQVTRELEQARRWGGVGFAPMHFRAAALAILDSQHNAVLVTEMEAMLGVGVVDALVKANILAVRPVSSWAVDILEEAFEDGIREPSEPSGELHSVVTAANSVVLSCMSGLGLEG